MMVVVAFGLRINQLVPNRWASREVSSDYWNMKSRMKLSSLINNYINETQGIKIINETIIEEAEKGG